jgi:hypothetical protein
VGRSRNANDSFRLRPLIRHQPLQLFFAAVATFGAAGFIGLAAGIAVGMSDVECAKSQRGQKTEHFDGFHS